ncbi:type VI secretion system protein TssA [Roseateles sp. BYS180W]|uniref:Type VI secretion system protein TssA n=1 Tax=Roseateles rivi TaxID=3299028 RepID=A0ABW7FS39_9BURK
MSTIDMLQRPLDGDTPCGLDMSFSPEFDRMREMRRQDDPTLDQGEWVTEIKRADWPGLLQLCQTLLSTRSKDLRIAGWYAEAATRVHGYGGLASGLRLYAGLVRNYWDQVHPLPEEGDPELRIGSVNWLLTQLQVWAQDVPLLRSAENTYTLKQIDSIRQKSGAARDHGDEQAQALLDALAKAQQATPVAEVIQALAHVREAQEALAELQTDVDHHLGQDGPGFVAARECLGDVLHSLERLQRDMGGTPEPSADSDSAPEAERAQLPAAGMGVAPTSRAQALEQLRLVAAYFRRTEPHSPVAYLAERAAKWGDMPLHQWLRAVTKDSNTLSQIEELLGVPEPESGR